MIADDSRDTALERLVDVLEAFTRWSADLESKIGDLDSNLDGLEFDLRDHKEEGHGEEAQELLPNFCRPLPFQTSILSPVVYGLSV